VPVDNVREELPNVIWSRKELGTSTGTIQEVGGNLQMGRSNLLRTLDTGLLVPNQFAAKDRKGIPQTWLSHTAL